jgi:hypothetical protein
MTDFHSALRPVLGLLASALLATGFIAAATVPAYAAPIAAIQTV